MRIEAITGHYETRHFGLATFLRYVLGPDSHIDTIKIGDRGFLFSFADKEGRARQLADEFFSDQSVAIENARELLECGRAVRQSLRAAAQVDQI